MTIRLRAGGQGSACRGLWLGNEADALDAVAARRGEHFGERLVTGLAIRPKMQLGLGSSAAASASRCSSADLSSGASFQNISPSASTLRLMVSGLSSAGVLEAWEGRSSPHGS